MKETELLPCPYCGSIAINVQAANHAIFCENCPAGVENWEMTKEELIKAWNTRKDAK